MNINSLIAMMIIVKIYCHNCYNKNGINYIICIVQGEVMREFPCLSGELPVILYQDQSLDDTPRYMSR